MPEGIMANTLRYRPELCTGCGLCQVVCPHGVFDAEGTPASLLHPERCIECGACRLNCPAGAIAVDSGAGCAWALMKASLRGGDKESCGCGGDVTCCGPPDGRKG